MRPSQLSGAKSDRHAQAEGLEGSVCRRRRFIVGGVAGTTVYQAVVALVGRLERATIGTGNRQRLTSATRWVQHRAHRDHAVSTSRYAGLAVARAPERSQEHRRQRRQRRPLHAFAQDTLGAGTAPATSGSSGTGGSSAVSGPHRRPADRECMIRQLAPLPRPPECPFSR
jgi:hypothetical protein